MKAKPSPLDLVDFITMRQEFSVVASTDQMAETVRFADYDIDVEFDVRENEFFAVVMKVEVNNRKEKLLGYSITMEVICIFQLDKLKDLPEDARAQIEGYSTFYITLNCVRGVISNLTASGPFGRYILPSLDLGDLIRQKRESITKTKTEKKMKTNKSKK